MRWDNKEKENIGKKFLKFKNEFVR